MKKSILRAMGGVLAAGALSAGAVLGVAGGASAIERGQCASHNLNVISSETTCWQNAGYAAVNLLGVYGLSSGNNAGYIQGSGGTTYFAKYESKSVPYQTISGIRIN